MRRDADKNKAEILSTLESMKTKGKIDTIALSKFGINVDRFNRTDKSFRMDTSPSAYDNCGVNDSINLDHETHT
jgi:hypothetical protein